MTNPKIESLDTTGQERALREALQGIQRLKRSIMIDVGSCHSLRGPGASSEMREDDRDLRRDIEDAFAKIDAALSLPHQPATDEGEGIGWRIDPAYTGPVVSFDFNPPYYLSSCDKCGWVGSSEHCGLDSGGDDSDVYCPRCHSPGADCGKVADRIPSTPPSPAAETRLREAVIEECAKVADVKGEESADGSMAQWAFFDAAHAIRALALTQPEPTAQQAAGEAVAWRVDDLTYKGQPCGSFTFFADYERADQYAEKNGRRFTKITPLYEAGQCRGGPTFMDGTVARCDLCGSEANAAPQPEAPAEVQQGVAWLYTKPKCFNIIRYQGERGLHVPEGFTETPLFATPQQGQEVEAEVVATCERLAARMGGRYVLRANDASDPQSAAAPADRDILHLARILEEWDMKPWPNDHTGHSYEDIARDALTRLALPAAASVEAGERAQIVGWLRDLAENHERPFGLVEDYGSRWALKHAADAIERGEHMAAKGKDQA